MIGVPWLVTILAWIVKGRNKEYVEEKRREEEQSSCSVCILHCVLRGVMCTIV